jgi:microcystin-dependent protein
VSEPFLAEIILFAGNFAPRGWAFCQGQILSIAQNTALFSLLGTTYGGNGTTTFALPDLRGRVPVGQGQGPGLSAYTLGEVSGSESRTLTVNQLASHTHVVNASNGSATGTRPSGNVPSGGGSQPFDTRQPYLVLNYIIALVGIFPSRN